MKILITGNTGFLGRHLVKSLFNHELHFSNTKAASLSSLENLATAFSNIEFDLIFHLAVKTEAGDYCLTHQGDQWIQNQIINTTMLQYWKEFQPQAKMIAFGTSCSYPENIEMREDNYLAGPPESFLETYAMTKRMLLYGLQALHNQFGMKYLYLIPSTLYGPEFDVGDKHFIFDLMRKIKNDSKIVLWGDGEQRRELIHVRDAISIIMKLVESKQEGIFNLSSSNDMSIKEYAQIICDIVGRNSQDIEYDQTKYVGVKKRKLINEKMLSSINHQFIDIKNGIKELI